jgi:hypothetical protein
MELRSIGRKGEDVLRPIVKFNIGGNALLLYPTRARFIFKMFSKKFAYFIF